jgi:hypothetical protein
LSVQEIMIMVAYFARRLAGGTVTLFLAGLLIYTLVIYVLGGYLTYMYEPRTRTLHVNCSSGCRDKEDQATWLAVTHIQETRTFDIDKPWPLSYLAWLFNPDEVSKLQMNDADSPAKLVVTTVPEGIDVGAGSLRLRGSGVLTGDLGVSTDVERGQKVTDLFGRGAGELMLLMVLALPVSMGVVLMQRRGRPSVKDMPYNPGRSMIRRVAYKTSATNELFTVQFGGVYSR